MARFATQACLCLHICMNQQEGSCISNLTCPSRVKHVLKPLSRNPLVFIRKAPQEPFLPLQKTEPLVWNFRLLS